MRIIDSHVHFWRLGGPGQSWPDGDWPLLYRDFCPADLLEAAAGINLDSAVAVQSQPDDRDTDWLLEITADTALIEAVVGWVDLASPRAPARIAQLAGQPKLRGLRPMLQAIDDSSWILRPELAPALAAMIDHNLRFDALIQPRHLLPLAAFARRWPQLPIVIDHGAKPCIARDEIEPWRAQLAELRQLPNVYCKLSGLRTEQAPAAPTAQLAPYVRHLVETFPQRLMWGSDWPVLIHAGDRYADWLNTTRALVGLPDEAACNALFSETARRFYGLA